ncbi:hypothetical protein PIROE2DRAFT_63896 [Piromyces sp. E2]|nr:hypothetical protein PIROE2DRAFT_63896 [Piromyces sp. E2]|eukprot:OUM59257.1 hypothetical protein PIROE2DRAFT_63896 [Piromyces sp. E2]
MKPPIDETETETETERLFEKNEQKKIIEKLKSEGKAIEKAQQQLNEELKKINSELSKISKNKNDSCSLEKLETRELLTKQKQELDKEKQSLNNKRMIIDKHIHNYKIILNKKKKH